MTCGSTARLGAGHLFTRQSYSTRWDLLNVHAQCWPCNYRHEFDFYPFQRWFVERYGQDEYDDLHKRFRTVSKITNADLMSIADTLEKIIEQMHGELSAN